MQDLTGEALRTAKGEITLELALRQSSSAIGDVARSSESLANVRKAAKASQEDLSAEIGQYTQFIAVAYNKSLIESNRNMIDMVQSIAEFVSKIKDSERFRLVMASTAFTTEKLSNAMRSAKESTEQLVIAFKDSVFSRIQAVINAIAQQFNKLGLDLSTTLTPLGVFTMALATLGQIFGLVGTAVSGVTTAVLELASALISASSVIINFYKGLATRNFDPFKESIESTGDAINNFRRASADGFGAVADGISNFTTKASEKAAEYEETIRNMANRTKDATDDINDSFESVGLDSSASAQAGGAVAGNAFSLGFAESFEKTIEKVQQVVEQSIAIAEFGFQQFTYFVQAASRIQQVEFQNRLEDLKYYKEKELEILTEARDEQLAILDEYKSQRLADIDEIMFRELEALGYVQEGTRDRFQQELDQAIASGDNKLIIEKQAALDRNIVEKEEAEERARIEKEYAEEKERKEREYQKRKAQLEHEAALNAWQSQRLQAIAQAAQAVLNAFSQGVGIGGPKVGAAFAAIAAGVGAMQIQAVNAAKPRPPKFAGGGIVPGTSFSGDRVTSQLNSGEMVLNENQQAQLFDVANGRASSSSDMSVVNIDSESMFDLLFKASRNQQLFISKAALV